MKSRTLLIVAVILLAVASLYPEAAMAQSAAEQEINELEQKMNAAYAANDLPTYFGYYSKDFTQWLPGRAHRPSSVRADVDRVHQEWRRCRVGRDFRYAYTDRPERRYRGCELPVARQDPLSQRKRSPTRCFRSRMSGSNAMEPGRLPTSTIHPRPRKNSYSTLRSIS